MDLALNKLQRLICHKTHQTKPNQNISSSISSTKSDVSICLTKTWTTITRLSIIWNSNLFDKIELDFFQAAVVSILRHGCTTWTLTKKKKKEKVRWELHENTASYILKSLWRCPWCNGYRRRKWTRRHEFKSWTWLIAFHIALIPLGKGWIKLFSLQLGKL